MGAEQGQSSFLPKPIAEHSLQSKDQPNQSTEYGDSRFSNNDLRIKKYRQKQYTEVKVNQSLEGNQKSLKNKMQSEQHIRCPSIRKLINPKYRTLESSLLVSKLFKKIDQNIQIRDSYIIIIFLIIGKNRNFSQKASKTGIIKCWHLYFMIFLYVVKVNLSFLKIKQKYQSKVKLSLLEIRGVSIIEVWNSKSLIVLILLSEQYGKLRQQ
ncbi:hypothetical protein pb186bvf_002885 [Paramecium bursaria]